MMIYPFNEYFPNEILPNIFKRVFPNLETLNRIFSVCTTWHAQRQATWEAILKDEEYPQLKKRQILYETSIGNAFILNGNIERYKLYQEDERVSHCRNAYFLGHYYPKISGSLDLKQLINHNEFERAFSGSRSLERQSELQEYLINKVGYTNALELIFLFNKEEFLKTACIIYLENGAKELEFLVKINNEELPDKSDLENLFEHPFFLSLKLLKEKNENVETLDEEVFDTYNQLFVVPALNYFQGKDDHSELKHFFDILPDDFSTPLNNSTNFKLFNALNDFFPFALTLLKPDKLVYSASFIKKIKEAPIPKKLLIIFIQAHLHNFYIKYKRKKNDSFHLLWPHLYKLEHALNCQTVYLDINNALFIDRSTEEFLKDLLAHQERLDKIFELNPEFAFAVVEILKKHPDILQDLIDYTEICIGSSLDKHYKDNTFFDVLNLLNKYLVHYSIRHAFIDSAPDHLKPILKNENAELRAAAVNAIFI